MSAACQLRALHTLKKEPKLVISIFCVVVALLP